MPKAEATSDARENIVHSIISFGYLNTPAKSIREYKIARETCHQHHLKFSSNADGKDRVI